MGKVAHRVQKKILNYLALQWLWISWHVCWELNSSSLEGQKTHSATQPFAWSCLSFFKKKKRWCLHECVKVYKGANVTVVYECGMYTYGEYMHLCVHTKAMGWHFPFLYHWSYSFEIECLSLDIGDQQASVSHLPPTLYLWNYREPCPTNIFNHALLAFTWVLGPPAGTGSTYSLSDLSNPSKHFLVYILHWC